MTRLLWLLMLAGTPLVYEVLLYITNKSRRYSNLGKVRKLFLFISHSAFEGHKKFKKK